MNSFKPAELVILHLPFPLNNIFFSDAVVSFQQDDVFLALVMGSQTTAFWLVVWESVLPVPIRVYFPVPR